MEGVSLLTLFIILVLLVLVSAFFSGSEIGMMSINRYRLRHMAKNHNKGAVRVERLLKEPDKLLGIILIGNTLANIVASAIATIIGQRLSGDTGVAIATGLLTLVILIFAEMTPKTLAAIYPEKVAFAVSIILNGLLRIFSPLILMISFMSNGILRLLGIHLSREKKESLSDEELRTVVNEAGELISTKHKSMLLSILDLEKVTVNDIMVPRTEIVGINLSESFEEILDQLETAQHTRLPVYEGGIDKVKGVIHIRSILNLFAEEKFDIKHLLSLIEKPYFVLEGTGLYQQLIQFQKEKKRSCFIVDEYGDIQGLVTLEDILEEIVGEFTTDMASVSKDVLKEGPGVYVVDASATIRELNRVMGWTLPAVGPKTLNGLITEILGFIPPPDCCLKVGDYPIEILQVKDNMVKTVRIRVSE